MSFISKHKLFLALLFILGATLWACTDDKLMQPDPSDAPEIVDPEGLAISFAVQLSSTDGATRDEASSVDDETFIDTYDNYVDTARMFKVFLFDQDGQFMFESQNRSVRKSADDNGQWYVTIPLNNSIRDDQNRSILGQIRSVLENQSFKIAVLANWHDEMPRSNRPEDITPFALNWSWQNSVLNSSADPANIRNINDLHHLVVDGNYSSGFKAPAEGENSDDNSNSRADTRAERYDTYSFLMDGDRKMGLKTNWVTSNIPEMSESYADTYIRQYWKPKEDPTQHPDYQPSDFLYRYRMGRLWQVWNFGGNYEGNQLPYGQLARHKDDKPETNPHVYLENELRNIWNKRSGENFETWLGEAESSNALEDLSNNDGFIFSNVPDNSANNYKNGVKSYAFHYNNYHGIKLGRTNYTEDKDGKNRLDITSQYNAGYIKIIAPATGKLRVIYGSPDGKINAKFNVQRGSNYEAQSNGSTSTTPSQYYRAISITGGPEEIYIYNEYANAPVVIYAIEYICDKYLSDTDRVGVEQPIPMYGVQMFPKIENWGAASVVNLSNTGLNINLIRSVAKVELYIRDRSNEEESALAYVGMRSMNRSSRCEPMDVETPTNRAWAKTTNLSYHDHSHCEWFDLKDYGPCYQPSGNESLQDYKNWLSWFYGAWNQKYLASGDGTGGSYLQKTSSDKWSWPFNGITLPSSDYYPHIFNPSIERTDFCEFIYKGKTASGYLRYILYMPDKFIDDPNTVGDRTATPKVAHVEYRYEKNSETYLDDNECHRIYFTDYSNPNAPINDVYSDEFDAFEKSNTSDLWPVMRNHIYRFYIGGDFETQEIYVKVKDWDTSTPPKKEIW
ncbi:MAG: hypothetical protein J1F38_05525 [Muribaculaceae bacterium]|nr:hypothetical protein [Muribaculaceae bacterium]